MTEEPVAPPRVLNSSPRTSPTQFEMQPVDTVIHARWIIPVDSSDSVLDNHSIAISEGCIQSIVPSGAAAARFDPENEVSLPEHAVIPGLINAHTHAAMSLLRGVAEDLPLEPWLQKFIWPIEGKWVSPQFVRDGTTLAFAEMIRSGTTCMNDMYMFPEVVGEVARATGMRAGLGMIVLEFPTAWAGSAQEYLEKGLELHRQFRDSQNVFVMLAPHAPYTVADSTFESIALLADQHDLPVHMHVHETAEEVSNSMQEHGVRPLERLNRLGLVNRRLIAVHATQLNDDEISLLAESQSSVAHCPKSNLKLASGICPVPSLLDSQVNVAIGTDGAASNNSLNMLEEMRFAALLAKGSAGNAAKVSVHDALRMSTINGAAALGLDSRIGSLEVGKCADITALNLGGLACMPTYDPVAQIVHAATRDQVSDVWVGGRCVLRNRELTTIDRAECKAAAERWGRKISQELSAQNAS